MSGSGSSQNSNSQSRPLTAAERQDLYNSSIGSINNTLGQSGQGYANSTPATFGTQSGNGIFNASGQSGSAGHSTVLNEFGFGQAPRAGVNMPTGTPDRGGINMPVYNTPTYQTPGAAQQMNGGDFSALQRQMTSGYTAPLNYAKEQDTKNQNAALAARGIWSSGLADKAILDTNTAYAPQYAQAGANATNAATQAQLTQNQNVNAYNTTNAQNANNFNTTQATNQNTADWAPLQYLKSLWDSTNGQTSGSSSLGWSASGGVIGGGK